MSLDLRSTRPRHPSLAARPRVVRVVPIVVGVASLAVFCLGARVIAEPLNLAPCQRICYA